MARAYVIDSSALLATLFAEPGAPLAEAALPQSVISAVNYSEVVARIIRAGKAPSSALLLVDSLDLPVVPWDADLAREASDLSSLGWTRGLSLGDRACLATARRLKRSVLTAERSWLGLPDLGLEIKTIR